MKRPTHPTVPLVYRWIVGCKERHRDRSKGFFKLHMHNDLAFMASFNPFDVLIDV